jgi:hypothetical protein
VTAWRVSLEDRKLGFSSIIIRMSAIRKLAAEAADNGLLAPELAAGIARAKSAKTQGIRTGNWLCGEQGGPIRATLRRDKSLKLPLPPSPGRAPSADEKARASQPLMIQ